MIAGLLGALLVAGLGQDFIPDEGRAEAVAVLLAERCAPCHSPGSDAPKARKYWPDARDLPATIAELVPGTDPEESDLYLSALDGTMPPDDSELQPLDDGELALLAGWISAGAPLPPSRSDEQESPAATPPEPEPGGLFDDPYVRWFGRTHPTLVHFPIALLTAALLAELMGRLWRSERLLGAASFCLGLGALAAFPTAALGWVLAEQSSDSADLLLQHRLLGIGVAVLALLTWVAKVRRSKLYLFLLLVSVGLVSLAGHTGGTLSYGPDWLAWPPR